MLQWLAAGRLPIGQLCELLCTGRGFSTPAVQVRLAVDTCLTGLFAKREVWPLTELRSLLHNWTARELDAALAALARNGEIVVEGGMVEGGMVRPA